MRKIYMFILIIIFFMISCEKDIRYNTLKEKEDDGKTLNVNPFFKSLNNSTLSNSKGPGMAYDSTGEIRILETSLPQGFTVNLDTGTILTIDFDTTGILRKVESYVIEGQELVMQTNQAEMGDVFFNAKFTLSTEEIVVPQTKSAKSNEEISRLLTDKNGMIHPVRITYQTPMGGGHKSALSNEGISQTDFEITLNDTCINETALKVWIDAYLKAFTSFILSFDYRSGYIEMIKWGFIWRPVYHPGVLEYFSAYYSGGIETGASVNMLAKYEAEYEKVKKLKNDLFKISYKFFVGPVPVFIDVSCDVYGHVKCNFEGQAKASSGFTVSAETKLGVEYKNGSLGPIKEFTTEKEFNPLKIEGSISAAARLEIYPQFMVDIYSAGGPTIDLVPYLSAEANASASYVLGENAFDAGWDASVDFGVDARIGAKLEILGNTLAQYNSGNIKIINPVNIWSVPSSIEILAGNYQMGSSYLQLPNAIVVVVKDSWKNKFPAIPVVFDVIDGEGSLRNHLKFTNLGGEVENRWILGKKGLNTCKAIIKKADGTVVSSVVFTAQAAK
jgi:hypothetical protein